MASPFTRSSTRKPGASMLCTG